MARLSFRLSLLQRPCLSPVVQNLIRNEPASSKQMFLNKCTPSVKKNVTYFETKGVGAVDLLRSSVPGRLGENPTLVCSKRANQSLLVDQYSLVIATSMNSAKRRKKSLPATQNHKPVGGWRRLGGNMRRSGGPSPSRALHIADEGFQRVRKIN